MRGTSETQLGLSSLGLISSDCCAFGPYADCWVPSKDKRFLEWAHLGGQLAPGARSWLWLDSAPAGKKRVLCLDGESPDTATVVLEK